MRNISKCLLAAISNPGLPPVVYPTTGEKEYEWSRPAASSKYHR
jgi:hypothetical protein